MVAGGRRPRDRRLDVAVRLSPIPLAFAVSAVAGFLFVWGERRKERAEHDVGVELFGIPSFRNGNIAAMIVSLGEFGIILSLPFWLQNVIGYSALQTGLVLLALAIGSFVASGFAGAFGNRVAPVTIVRVGLAAEIVGVAGLGFVIGAGHVLGGARAVPVRLRVRRGSCDRSADGCGAEGCAGEKSGQGSGTQSTARQIGSALGIAILGTVLFTTHGRPPGRQLDDRGCRPTQRDRSCPPWSTARGQPSPGSPRSRPPRASPPMRRRRSPRHAARGVLRGRISGGRVPRDSVARRRSQEGNARWRIRSTRLQRRYEQPGERERRRQMSVGDA